MVVPFSSILLAFTCNFIQFLISKFPIYSRENLIDRCRCVGLTRWCFWYSHGIQLFYYPTTLCSSTQLQPFIQKQKRSVDFFFSIRELKQTEKQYSHSVQSSKSKVVTLVDFRGEGVIWKFDNGFLIMIPLIVNWK